MTRTTVAQRIAKPSPLFISTIGCNARFAPTVFAARLMHQRTVVMQQKPIAVVQGHNRKAFRFTACFFERGIGILDSIAEMGQCEVRSAHSSSRGHSP